MLPSVLHAYQNHHLDSRRWDFYKPRDNDIVISTSIKSGTTLTQEIVGHLVFHDHDPSERSATLAHEISPWLDFRPDPLEEVLTKLEAQKHRRFIKAHLALDGLPYYPQVKYLVVARDARDVFMSFWNHFSHYTPEAYVEVNDAPQRVGPPLPHCPEDIHEAWKNWITCGWFEWESEGYPFWGNMHHSQSWWDYRHLDNIYLVHYADLLNDLPGEIRGMADFLEIAISAEGIQTLLPDLSIESMRSLAQKAGGWQQTFQGGTQTFFFKGNNGRWRQLLSDEEVALYDATASRVLTPECRAWLEQGRVALT